MHEKEFIEICSDKDFWKAVRRNKYVSYKHISDVKKRMVLVKNTYKEIALRTYYPSPPEKYLVSNKGYGVIRVVPALSIKDILVYYYCARKLERYIASNRTDNTFGGWGLSGKLRRAEEQEDKEIKDQIIVLEDQAYIFKSIGSQIFLSSSNAFAWFREWNDFTHRLYERCKEEEEGYVAELDIANYYDSIQIDNLIFKIRKVVPPPMNSVVYLLEHFLKFWNRHINFYRQQGSGLPQDIFGECSRILANFYLQDYDKKISRLCSEKGGQYFRYADDQVFFANSKQDLEELIARASSLLMREGLNLNQKKVRIFSTKDFKKYHAFESFKKLTYPKNKYDKAVIGSQIKFFLKNRKNLKKSGVSLLRCLISRIHGQNNRRGIPNLKELKNYLLVDYIPKNSHLSQKDMQKIYDLLNVSEKNKMISIINKNISNSWYTQQLYDIRAFYRTNKIPVREVGKRITKVKNTYQFSK